MIKRPVAVGLLVCENAIVEERTRNLSLINCFNLHRVAGFPSPPQKMAAVAFLVDGVGDMALAIVVQQLATGEEIFRGKLRMEFTDPLQDARAVFRFNNLVFPHPGKFQLTLLADGEFVAQHVFQVFERESA